MKKYKRALIFLTISIILSLIFIPKIFSQDSLQISQLRKSFYKTLSEPQEGVNLRVSWTNMNYDAGVTLNLYQLINNDKLLIKQKISPADYKGLNFIAQWDTDSLYTFFMTAVKENQESIPSSLVTWKMEKFELYPPQINIYKPYVTIEFEQYHIYRKFTVTINNQTGGKIDTLLLKLDNCVFDWAVYNGKLYFKGEDSKDGENEGTVSNTFRIFGLEKNQIITINTDIDKSATVAGFKDAVQGRIIVNGIKAKLKKEQGKEIYKAEIKF